jgi:hypothetical protein
MNSSTLAGLGLAIASTIATAASADVTISLVGRSFSGLSFIEALDYEAGQELVGVLTAASINVTLDASVAYTYADDLCLYVGSTEFTTGGLLQIGGYDNLGANERLGWPNGNWDAPGTTSIGTVTLLEALQFNGNRLTDGTIWIGNGYGSDEASGTWTGTITLHGVDVIPAPGAIALLGLAGLVARRRR